MTGGGSDEGLNRHCPGPTPGHRYVRRLPVRCPMNTARVAVDVDDATARLIQWGASVSWWPVLALPEGADLHMDRATSWRWLGRPVGLTPLGRGHWSVAVELSDPEPRIEGVTLACSMLEYKDATYEYRRWAMRMSVLGYLLHSLEVVAWQIVPAYAEEPGRAWRQPGGLGPFYRIAHRRPV